MQVLNNSLLNILLPNDNKALKDVLKQADTNTLEQMINNKSANVNEVIKNLFEQLKNGKSNNSNIENILKNSNVFKELGSFNKNISNLLTNLEQNSSNPKLENFKGIIENLFKDIKDLDATNLKEQISKTGIFLESKIAQNGNLQNSKLLDTLLNQIQNLIKNIDSPQTKVINQLLTDLQNSNLKANEQLVNLKSLLTNLQTLSNSLSSNETQTLNNLTNQLQNLIKDSSLIESKIQNNIPISTTKEQLNTQTKELLNQIRNEFIQNPNLSNSKNLISQMDDLIKTNDLFKQNSNFLEPKTVLNAIANSTELKSLSTTNQNISNLVLNLKNIVENISTLETKALNLQNITDPKNTLLQNITETLSNLKTELSNIKGVDATNLNQLISKLDNLQNLFSKIEVQNNPILQNLQTLNQGTFLSNFANNLNSILLNLKESLTQSQDNPQNLNLQNDLQKNITKVENIIRDVITNPNILKNDFSMTNDMKSVLLQLTQELANKSDPNSQEIMKQVERLLTQIDLHQLNSLNSNSNYVYIPFFWEMLEDGSINMKKSDEEKFYCQINLTLKDNGKLDLMLALYDNNKIEINMYAQREHFKDKLKENIPKLRQALNSVDLIPISIKLYDLKEVQEDKKTQKTNIYSNTNLNDDLDLGLNIRV